MHARTRRRFAVAVAWLAGALAATGANARAQATDPPRILLVCGPGVSHTMQRDLTTVYADLGTVGTDPDYDQRAQQAGVKPTSAEAMAALLPAYAVDLGVIVERAGLSLRVSYYAGTTGAPVLQDTLHLEGRELDPTDDFYLRARARRALEAAQAARAQAPAWAPGAGGAPQPPSAGYEPLPEETPPSEAAPTMEDSTTESTPATESEPPPLRVRLSAGFGVAMHSTQLPSATGTQRVADSLVPGFDVVLEGEAAATVWRPGLRLDYRSSLGYTQTETLPGGVDRSSPARKHELLADLTLRPGGGARDDSVSVPISLGVALRDMRTEVEMGIPRYTLAGPHARVLVRFPIAAGALIAELGPEFQWLLSVANSLERRGIGKSGVAIGWEAGLRVPFAEDWSARLLYRESHAFLDTLFDASFLDTQRFVTLGVGASYR